MRTLPTSLIVAPCWALVCVLLAPLAAQAQDIRVSTDILSGVDVWDMRTSVDEDTTANQSGNRRLFFANSDTSWPYQNASPWLRFQGTVRPLSNTLLTLKFRSDQALGSQVDELSLDQSWHAFGARVGVLDYKTTWCRTWEASSPWVRENDPFCTVNSTSRSVSAAPGMQLYANFVLGNTKWQSVVGNYSPLLLNYDSTEFTNSVLNELSRVIQNNKWGASIEATHLETALQLRLSYLHTDQSADYQSDIRVPTYRIDHQVDVIYAGVSFNPTPLVNLRLTQLHSNLTGTSSYPAGYTRPDDRSPQVISRDTSPKKSTVVELNYQASARDVFSLALSEYELETDSSSFRVDLSSGAVVETYYPRFFYNRTTNTSLSWRRDWAKGVFTVLQWSSAQVGSSTNSSINAPPKEVSSNGQAFGLRLGYRF